jgi:predicted DNA-binding protein (MmcQ/YjbR family)
MMSLEEVRALALSFPEAEEQLHFEKPSFRVRKKIFATLHVQQNRAVLKLSEEDQSVFGAFGKKDVFFPVPGAWGKQGWTFVDLKKVRKDMFRDALTQSYSNVAPKKLKKN